MIGLRKHVDWGHALHLVAPCLELDQIAGKRRRIARHVGNCVSATCTQALNGLLAQAAAWRIDDDLVGCAQAAQLACGIAPDNIGVQLVALEIAPRTDEPADSTAATRCTSCANGKVKVPAPE